jgi:hypothetical protein
MGMSWKLESGDKDRKCLKLNQVVYETHPLLNMKFCVYFAHFCVCVSEIFHFHINYYIKMEKLTNTYKLTQRNEQNTHKTSYLGVEEFYTLPGLSLYIFYLWYRIRRI